MTHHRPARARAPHVNRLAGTLMRSITSAGATITESFEAIHEVQMDMVHTTPRLPSAARTTTEPRPLAQRQPQEQGESLTSDRRLQRIALALPAWGRRSPRA